MSSNDQNQQNQISGAITYPGASDRNAQPTPSQPRQPRNLQGLLRFAMEATKAEDAPGNSTLGPLDEERRKFLEEALKSLTVDISELLRNAIKTLTDTERIQSLQMDQPIPEDVDRAFNNLEEFVDDIDVANDFYKMGGFAVFPICYGSSNEVIRAKASNLLAELCQNNPFCQARALECGLLNVLLNLVETEKGTALVKCIYALSCACREFAPSCQELISQNGGGSLARRLQSEEPAARTKAAFFVRYLAHHYPQAKTQFINEGIVKIIADQVKKGRDETTEHLISILVSLAEGLDPLILQQLRNPQYDLKKVLEDHLKHPDLNGDTFVEEKEYCAELLKILQTGKPDSTENEVDR